MESAAPGLWEVLAVVIVGILIICIIVTAQGSGPRWSPKPLLTMASLGSPGSFLKARPLWQGTSQDEKWRVRSLVKRQVLIT